MDIFTTQQCEIYEWIECWSFCTNMTHPNQNIKKWYIQFKIYFSSQSVFFNSLFYTSEQKTAHFRLQNSNKSTCTMVYTHKW
jgi:hypothetical protein